MAAIVEARDLVKTYVVGETEIHALAGVSLAVEPGEFVAIMGPSGSGKSTLMNMLGLLDTPTSGTYLIDGVDVSTLVDDELAEARSRSIGFVFQSFNLLPRATVRRNVGLPLIYSEMAVSGREARVIASMRAAGLDETLWDKRSNQLSGGQMQRVAIARALVNDPTLILADEPTGNLDSKTGAAIADLLLGLAQNGNTTLILVTHDEVLARRMARIVRLADGRVVADGTP